MGGGGGPAACHAPFTDLSACAPRTGCCYAPDRAGKIMLATLPQTTGHHGIRSLLLVDVAHSKTSRWRAVRSTTLYLLTLSTSTILKGYQLRPLLRALRSEAGTVRERSDVQQSGGHWQAH